jgi:hypothetical protein
MKVGDLMSIQVRALAAAVFATGMTSLSSVAPAAHVADALAIKDGAPTNVQATGGGGWGWGWGFGAGLVGGAIIGGALAAPYYYRPYYGPYYYPAPAYGPGPGDPVAYCMQRFQSYDPQSGTYLGYDGLRHPCP